MANSIEAKYIDLYINPVETIPPFNSAADLLNAVLLVAKRVSILEMRSLSIGSVPKHEFPVSVTHFFLDGIVSITSYDKEGYKRFIDGKEQSYTAYLESIHSGVVVYIDYRTSVRWEEKSPVQ